MLLFSSKENTRIYLQNIKNRLKSWFWWTKSSVGSIKFRKRETKPVIKILAFSNDYKVYTNSFELPARNKRTGSVSKTSCWLSYNTKTKIWDHYWLLGPSKRGMWTGFWSDSKWSSPRFCTGRKCKSGSCGRAKSSASGLRLQDSWKRDTRSEFKSSRYFTKQEAIRHSNQTKMRNLPRISKRTVMSLNKSSASASLPLLAALITFLNLLRIAATRTQGLKLVTSTNYSLMDPWLKKNRS